MDAYFINTLKVQKSLLPCLFHVFMYITAASLIRPDTYTSYNAANYFFSLRETCWNVDAKADKDSQACFEERLLFPVRRT